MWDINMQNKDFLHNAYFRKRKDSFIFLKKKKKNYNKTLSASEKITIFLHSVFLPWPR